MEQAPTAAFPAQLLNGALKGWVQGQGAAADAASAGAPPTTCRASVHLLLRSGPLLFVTSHHGPIPVSSSRPQAPRLRPPRGTASRAELLSARLSSVLLVNATADSRGLSQPATRCWPPSRAPPRQGRSRDLRGPSLVLLHLLRP